MNVIRYLGGEASSNDIYEVFYNRKTKYDFCKEFNYDIDQLKNPKAPDNVRSSLSGWMKRNPESDLKYDRRKLVYYF